MKIFSNMEGALNLTSLNHVSLVCKSVKKSLDFYQSVLGFFPIRRPGSFNFDGAWLFNYGIGIHLLQSENPEMMASKRDINPKDNHIAFQCESMAAVEGKLEEMKIHYIKNKVEEGGVFVNQIFFHDPEGFMIEICDCENLPVVPLGGEAAPLYARPGFRQTLPEMQLPVPLVTSASKCLPAIRWRWRGQEFLLSIEQN